MKVIKDETTEGPLNIPYERAKELMTKSYAYMKDSTDSKMTSLLQNLADICDTKEEVAFVVSGVVQMLNDTGGITLGSK